MAKNKVEIIISDGENLQKAKGELAIFAVVKKPKNGVYKCECGIIGTGNAESFSAFGRELGEMAAMIKDEDETAFKAFASGQAEALSQKIYGMSIDEFMDEN